MKLLRLFLTVLIICSMAAGAKPKNRERRSQRRRPAKHQPVMIPTTTEPTTLAKTTAEMQPDEALLKHKPQFTINGPVPDAPRSPENRGVGPTSRRQPGPENSRNRGAPVPGTRSLGSNRLSSEQQLILLEAHNDFRGQVRPTAANMVALQWDDELADLAQTWADQCVFMHGGTTGGRFGWVGQNLWAGSGTGWDLYGMIESWFNEEQYYTYSNGNCNGVCGHYTQVVWAQSKFVGCALRTCPSIQGLNGWSPASILVCNYGEGGNFIGRKPYISGSPCSRCPAGYTSCIDGELCALPEQVPTNGGNDETETSPEIPNQPDVGAGPIGPGVGGNPGSGTDGSNQPASCGGTLRAFSGEITSPNWPTPYGSNSHCEWLIQGKSDQTVTLQVTYMDIEAERRCSWDYLQLKPNGPSGLSTKHCGNVNPTAVTSQGNEMRVVFHSDDSVNKGGFTASYRLNGGEQEENTVPVCGGEINGKKGNIRTPNYPKTYGENLDCLWTIQVADNKRIRLTFQVFEVEENANCDFDRVTIRIGNERVPMVFCGNEKPNGNIISLSNRMEIRFTTDGSNHRKGFSASWRAI
ncbi:cubilin-like [Patiria miniata]|uniref:CUB domain-containing protein n=1 Tax=Patiria miniata TaxID=46514 RepID=A0A914B640_PATMI|nr:cubilin-like [Patiria miniata]